MLRKNLSFALSLMLAVPQFLHAATSGQAQAIEPRETKSRFAPGKHNNKLSSELQDFADPPSPPHKADHKVRVIIQTTASAEQLSSSLHGRRGQLKRALPVIGGYVAEV